MPVELHPLSLGIMPTMDVFPFIVAQKSGIYDSLGLKVNLVQFDSPYDRDAAFLTGKIDGTITDYPSIALLQVHHPGGSVIMATQGYFCFITNRQNPINQFDELKEIWNKIRGNKQTGNCTDTTTSQHAAIRAD